MGQRRAGLERMGTRRAMGGAAAAAATGTEIYDPGVWYVWGFAPRTNAIPNQGDTTPIAAERLTTFPHYFSVSGIIKKLAYIWIAGSRSVRFHLYTPHATNKAYPGALAYASSSFTPNTGFAWVASQASPELEVEAGDCLYGGLQESGANAAGASVVDCSTRMPIGTFLNPADPNGTHGIILHKVGYRPSNTYASGAPDPFPAIGTPETSHADVYRNNSGAPGALLFQFEMS